MCITAPCADPTLPGVWWRENDRWGLYSAEHQKAIQDGLRDGLARVDLGVIASAVHPQGARYEADLTAMQQRNLSSGYNRAIKVVQPGIAQPPAAATAAGQSGESPSSSSIDPSVHWRDNGGSLRSYDAETARVIMRAIREGKRSTQTRTMCTPAYPGGIVYYVDLKRMRQRNPFTATEREVVLVVPHSFQSLAALAAQVAGADRRLLLGAALEAFCSEARVERELHALLAPKQLQSKRRNDNARPGVPFFDRFIAAMDSALCSSLQLAASSLFVTPASPEAATANCSRAPHFSGLTHGKRATPPPPPPLELALHGTPPHNVLSILRDGLLPENGKHWFARKAGVSVPYADGTNRPWKRARVQESGASACAAKGGTVRLLLFVLLAGEAQAESGWTSGSVVTVQRAEFSLPLYEVCVG